MCTVGLRDLTEQHKAMGHTQHLLIKPDLELRSGQLGENTSYTPLLTENDQHPIFFSGKTTVMIAIRRRQAISDGELCIYLCFCFQGNWKVPGA